MKDLMAKLNNAKFQQRYKTTRRAALAVSVLELKPRRAPGPCRDFGAGTQTERAKTRLANILEQSDTGCSDKCSKLQMTPSAWGELEFNRKVIGAFRRVALSLWERPRAICFSARG